MYLSFLDHHTGKDSRKYQLIEVIADYFDPVQEGSHYFIMDPYFDVLKSIENPLKEATVEDDNWSFLISMLAHKDVTFKIITREGIQSALFLTTDPPFLVPSHKSFSYSRIEVCKYIDKKFSGLSLHDRFIIKEKDGVYKGLHIGPSLTDADDKDISLTSFTNKGAISAIQNFNRIWTECKVNRGWKKG